MNIRKSAAAFAAALVLGSAILGSTTPAHALPKEPKTVVYCYIMDNGNGEIELFLPGEMYYNPWSKEWQTCGEDGIWYRVRGGQTTVAPKPGGGVLAQ
jgi:hypothetical protein